MIGQPAPASAPLPGFSVFWGILGRLVTEVLSRRGYGSFVIQIEDGKIKRVHMNQSFAPEQLPRI